MKNLAVLCGIDIRQRPFFGGFAGLSPCSNPMRPLRCAALNSKINSYQSINPTMKTRMTPTALSTPLLAAMLGLAIVGLPQTMVAQSEKAMKALGDRDLEIWNKGNLALINEVYAPDYVVHNVNQLLDVEVKGAAAMKQYVTSVRTSYPDLHIRRDDLFIKGNRMITRCTATGTNTGPLPGPAGTLPP